MQLICITYHYSGLWMIAPLLRDVRMVCDTGPLQIQCGAGLLENSEEISHDNWQQMLGCRSQWTSVISIFHRRYVIWFDLNFFGEGLPDKYLTVILRAINAVIFLASIWCSDLLLHLRRLPVSSKVSSSLILNVNKIWINCDDWDGRKSDFFLIKISKDDEIETFTHCGYRCLSEKCTTLADNK